VNGDFGPTVLRGSSCARRPVGLGFVSPPTQWVKVGTFYNLLLVIPDSIAGVMASWHAHGRSCTTRNAGHMLCSAHLLDASSGRRRHSLPLSALHLPEQEVDNLVTIVRESLRTGRSENILPLVANCDWFSRPSPTLHLVRPQVLWKERMSHCVAECVDLFNRGRDALWAGFPFFRRPPVIVEGINLIGDAMFLKLFTGIRSNHAEDW
jgi:hypothetical protein